MGFPIFLTDDAVQDLGEIVEYIAEHDSPRKANHVLDRIENAIENLSHHPHRGAYPKELLKLGIHEYRQAFFKPYRIIYRVCADRVYIYLIADGRRDMQTLLQRRLLMG